MHTSRAEASPHRFRSNDCAGPGLAGITNGTLLQLAEEHFDVLITSDQNLKYQQNLANRQLAILRLPTNKVPIVVRLAPVVQSALENIKAGDFVEIGLKQIEQES